MDDEKLTIAQFDISFIRQVLLTDEFSSLRVSNAHAVTVTTPSFTDFSNFESNDLETTMRRAFRDHLVAQSDIRSLQDLVITLHTQLRALVPNRKDLHTLVHDEAVMAANHVCDLLPMLIHASLALEALESEARAETTSQWREVAQAKLEVVHHHNSKNNDIAISEFMVTSTLYLLFKTELCLADKQNFYLQHVWAPRIHVEGPSYLRQWMDEKFNGEYPLTMAWLHDLLENQHLVEPQSDDYRTMLRKGWIETIVFHRGNSTHLPEVFSLDVENIRLIRRVCQQAVAASALIWHAQVGNDCEPTSDVGMRQADLLSALTNNRSPTYEEDVSDAVIALVRASDTPTDEASLRSRTISVLRGQDPVIKLLDRRMQEMFAHVSVMDAAGIPVRIASGGVGVGAPGVGRDAPKVTLERTIEESFHKKGIWFHTSELATLCLLAKRIVDLVWCIHHDMIEQTFREAMST